MRRVLLFIFLLLYSSKIMAQLDTEHWFAAMYDGQSNSSPYQYLYLSTNDTTPFEVSIYSGNKVISQVTISKANPRYVFIPRQYIIVNRINVGELLKPIDKGLFVKAERRFFANLRFGMQNHAEIVTSKGIAALGKQFYTVVAPNNIASSNDFANNGFQASVIATLDDTTITVSQFQKPLQFTNGNLSGAPITFKLNRGQSYIVDGRGIISGNRDGFIGAKITADKPIALTNGNINGQYVPGTNENDGSDILMDQSVSVENLGNEFGIISGMGIINGTGDETTNRGMERAIIVATMDGTDVYLNNSALPVKTLKEGEYYFVPDTYYAKKSTDHYNLFIKTSKNVYVYQVLGGVRGSLATGSMNFIPPLGCYLPLKIDEIGYVDQLNPGAGPMIVKLNIISEQGAKVKINGIPIDASQGYGPFPLEGNSGWETYSVPDVHGNIAIESDKAVNAGLAGGDGNNVGYAGYFAGFSAIPFIVKKQGDCIPDVVLELPEGYDSYQWFYKNDTAGVAEPIVGANTNMYVPTRPGFYAVTVQRGGCSPVTTQDYRLLNCAAVSTFTLSSCNNSLPISPLLSASTQATDWESITITDPPAKGTVKLDKINKIFEYIPTPDVPGIDLFEYSFCGVSSLPDCEKVTVNVYLNIVAKDDIIHGCKINAAEGEFNLTLANVTSDPSVISKIYYKTQSDADSDTGVNTISTAMLSKYTSEEGFVYVRLKSSTCSRTAKIELKFFPTAELVTDTYEVCDNKLEGKINVQLDQLTSTFLKNHTYFTDATFHTDPSASTTPVASNWSYSSDSVLYLKVLSPDGCKPAIFPISFKVGAKIPVITLQNIEEVCDDEADFFDFKKTVTLRDYTYMFTGDSAVTAKFYIYKEDAQNNRNNDITTYLLQNEKRFYVRLSKPGICDNLVELTLKVKIPERSLILENKEICAEKLTTLDAGAGFAHYQWYNENNPAVLLGEDAELKNVGLGRYYVDLTATNGCTYRQTVTVTAVELPEIKEILIQNNTVTITAIKGNPPYLYSIDGVNYQSSNVFANVRSGYHSAYVISADDCKPVKQEFTIIEIYNTLTPNGDGINDVLDLSLLETKVDVLFWIHDRNGNRIFEGNKSNRFIWNGLHNGRSFPTSSYWYLLQWKDFDYSAPVKYTGWILLKNRN